MPFIFQNHRCKVLSIIICTLLLVVLPIIISHADIIIPPPVVTIMDYMGNTINEVTINENENFTLIAVWESSSNWFSYEWTLSGNLVESGTTSESYMWFSDYSIPNPGNYSLVLSMTDAIGQIGTAALEITVLPLPSTGGDICGSVQQSGGLPAAGVTVTLLDENDEPLGDPVVSDETGGFYFADLDQGSYSVMIVTPLGFTALPGETQMEIHPDDPCTEVTFELAPIAMTNECRSMAYWANQLHRALCNHPKDYTLGDFSGFCGLIKEHFNQNPLNPVDYYNVPQPADQADSLNALRDLLLMRWHDNDDPFLKHLAKAQLMALMLNVVSGRVSQVYAASADGLTISQVITFCDMLVSDEVDPPLGEHLPGYGSPWFRYIYASFMLVKANHGLTIPAGMIPEDVLQILYRFYEPDNLPDAFTLSQNYPNPFNAQTQISFDLPASGYVTMEIYNIAGQHVATLVDEYLQAGHHRINWDASDCASGVYLYRLAADHGSAEKKMILLK
jgi:hypothetical protein